MVAHLGLPLERTRKAESKYTRLVTVRYARRLDRSEDYSSYSRDLSLRSSLPTPPAWDGKGDDDRCTSCKRAVLFLELLGTRSQPLAKGRHRCHACVVQFKAGARGPQITCILPMFSSKKFKTNAVPALAAVSGPTIVPTLDRNL
jgi:hypothetical protein